MWNKARNNNNNENAHGSTSVLNRNHHCNKQQS